jgi:AcrR family transcriptional regulator
MPARDASGTARSPRRRRTVEEARAEILAVAERILMERGPDAVRVQVVAREVGITDAAVHYHFGNREGLLDALLRRLGRRLKSEFGRVIEQSDADDLDVGSLVDLLDDTYRVRGYARLTAWMRLSGWRPSGAGMFRAHAEEIHDTRVLRARQMRRRAPDLDDTLHSVALLNLVAWADPLIGGEWRRSVGLPATPEAAARFREWFAALVQEHLLDGGPPARR